MRRDQKPATLPAINNDSLPFLSKSVLIINLPSDVWPLLVIERYAIWSGLDIPGVHFPVTGSQPTAPNDVSGARWHHLVVHFLTPPDLQSTSSRALRVIASVTGTISKFYTAYQLIGSSAVQFLGLIRQRSVACQSVGPFSAGFFISVMKWFIWWRIAMDQPNTPFWGVGNTLDILTCLLSFMSVFNDVFQSRINSL